MKNTVYALAAQEAIDEPDAFGLTLARHFLDRNPRLARVRIEMTEHPWGRIIVGNREHGQAFVRQGGESRSATIEGDRTRVTAAQASRSRGAEVVALCVCWLPAR